MDDKAIANNTRSAKRRAQAIITALETHSTVKKKQKKSPQVQPEKQGQKIVEEQKQEITELQEVVQKRTRQWHKKLNESTKTVTSIERIAKNLPDSDCTAIRATNEEQEGDRVLQSDENTVRDSAETLTLQQIRHYQSQKNLNDASILHKLGVHFTEVAPNIRNARKYLNKAIKLGNVQSMMFLAQKLLQDEAEQPQVQQIQRRAAQTQPALSDGEDEQTKANNKPIPNIFHPNLKKGLELLENAAVCGDLEAHFQLGVKYQELEELDLSQNEMYELSFEHFERAAEGGHARAQYKLGRMYDYGLGVQQDRKKAFDYYQIASDKGITEAIFKMGVMYHKARGVAENFEKALDYYERAADLGQPNAIYNLGNSFMKGVMNKKRIQCNIQKAAHYLQKAAEMGHQKAQYQLGRLYVVGMGVPKSLEQALKWFRASAQQRFAPSRQCEEEINNVLQQHERRTKHCAVVASRLIGNNMMQWRTSIWIQILSYLPQKEDSENQRPRRSFFPQNFQFGGTNHTPEIIYFAEIWRRD